MSAGEGFASRAEERLFADALSCELELPVAVMASDGRGRQAQATTLLASLAQLEDLRKDDGEEHGDLPLLAQRMDAKLDLVLSLLGRLVNRGDDAMPVRAVRWSRRGVRVDLGGEPALADGAAVVLRLQPTDWLPDHIELPATVLDQAHRPGGVRAWFAFSDLSPALSEAMDRHLFRMHRRQIAGQRRS